MGWLFATMATAAIGAVFPLVNIELYLLGVISQVDGVSWWMLGLAATVGQVTGKSLFFFAGRGSLSLGKRLGTRFGPWLEARVLGRIPQLSSPAQPAEHAHESAVQKAACSQAVSTEASRASAERDAGSTAVAEATEESCAEEASAAPGSEGHPFWRRWLRLSVLWTQRAYALAQERPAWGVGVLFVGAVTGIPPFSVMCLATGAARMRFHSWLLVSLTGRGIHFLVVAAFPGLVGQMLAG